MVRLESLLAVAAIAGCLLLVFGLLAGCEFPTSPQFTANDNGYINYWSYDSQTYSGNDSLINQGECQSECTDDGNGGGGECKSIPSGTPVPPETCIQNGGSRECDCS